MNARLRPQLIAGIHWVRGELEQSIARARALIDHYAEGAGDSLQLQQAYVELYQVRGTAAMIQCYGLATVAGEMAAALQDLTQERIAEPEPLLSALLGATIQLGDYVQALADGMPDCVLVMQPAINELRLARAQAVLTETELFIAQMQALGTSLPVPDDQLGLNDAARQQAQRLLPAFQSALLTWVRGGAEAQTSAARAGKIAEQIARNASNGVVYQLWRSAAAAVEAFLGHGIVNALELKRLFGRLAAQLRVLADAGEAAASAQAADLSLQLLFLIGRSTGSGERALALRRFFDLDDYLPDAAALEQLRRRIHGPSTSLLAKVADEIRTEFVHVKDQIDLMVRTGAGDAAATSGSLQRIGDTLGALGLSRLQQMITGQTRRLSEAPDQVPTPAACMELATTILRVENDLEEALFRQMHRASEDPPQEARPETPASRDLAEGREALHREFLVNLARVKSIVDAYLSGGGSGELPDAVLMIDEIAAGFEVLAQPQAAELCRRLRRFIAGPLFAELRDDPARAERFADAVAAVEYYIEAVRAGLPTAEGILGDLQNALDALDLAHEAGAETAAFDVPRALQSETRATAAVPVGAVVDAAPAAGGEDPEIREIFLEEAAEVLASAQAAFAIWSRDSQDRAALTTLRRAFHTLKGSGRTVGATAIGEFGWALESMLNKCLDGSIALSAGVVDTVSRGLAVLPGLIAAFRERQAPPAEATAVMEQAREHTDARVPAALPEADIAQVFREDAGEKLAAVLAWLEGQPASAEVSVDREVVRAFHTIRGAARVVEAQAVGELAGAVEVYLDMLAEARLRLGPAALALLREASTTLRRWIDDVGTTATARHDAGPLLARIAELEQAVPGGAARASADRQLAEIFSSEAFELVSKIEDQLRGWSQAPDNRRAAQDLSKLCHTLLGAAQMSACPAIASVARALHSAFDVAAARAIVPDAAALATLLETCEGLFQYLDRFRDGALERDDADWAGRIDALGWADATLIGGKTAGPDQDLAPPAAPADAGGAIAVAEAPASPTPDAGASDEVLEMPPVASPDAADEVDPQLRQIFLSEAEELLEGLDQSAAELERDPLRPAPLGHMKRLLHTFKGSAYVAGLQTLGDVAHRLESLFDQLDTGAVRPGSQFFARVHNALDGLHLAIDDARRGQMPEPLALLAELSQPLAEAAAPPEHAPAVPLEPLASVVPAPQAAPAPGLLPVGFDIELAQTFAGEAEELMEVLEAALPRWQALPGDFAPARNMLRALHTFKGGARMSGLALMGDAAHELESLIEGLEYAGELDAGALRVVAGAVAELRQMTDRLERGEYAALTGIEALDAESAAEAPAPVVPVVSAAPPAAAAAPTLPAADEAPPPVPPGMWDPLLFWRPDDDAEALAAQRRETARVPVEALDRMLNEAGEIAIYRSRLEEHNAAIQGQLGDMAQAIQRVRDQLRQLDIETEAQIAARGLTQTEGSDRYAGEFDPLEMDRYTRMQELSRALNESVGDLAAVQLAIDQIASEETTILLQQGRTTTEVQQGLMRTLMVPFSRQVARLQRVVQQTAAENGKRVDISFDGVEAELDRNVLERMTAPLEHLLRNAVVHGIEPPAQRESAGKPATGQLTVTLWREGTQLFIELADDGRGLDLGAIRETAVRRGLMPPGAVVSDDEAAQFIFMPGFSTARQLTRDAGRGVGMDVVAAEVKQLGGSLELASETGKGARFKVRLPLTLALSQALLVGVGHELYAAPLSSVEGIARIAREQLDALLAETGPKLEYGGQHYHVLHLADLVGLRREAPAEGRTAHAILVRMPESLGGEERRIAVIVDQLLGSRQVVSKAVGPQVSSIAGLSGATLLADGRVVLILDIAALVQDRTRRVLRTQVALEHGGRELPAEAQRELIMVVDDSITIRRVTERLLAKHGFAVITAKDGLDAMAQLQTERPAAILLDIEMPRADGFEVATFVRNSAAIADTPILMITSRSGDKHRERAAKIGADRYLIKPYQEDQLLSELRDVLRERRA